MSTKSYNARETEKKWQKIWEERGIYTCDLSDSSRKKYYALVMFPYPSGDKLHIGHWYNFGGADSYARYMRLRGYNVFEPIGFDSFGLPAENYAIKTGTPPPESTAANCDHMRRQLWEMGAMYDWSKEVVTSSPLYYTWTQWVFLQLYEKGLAYRAKAPVNWCPSCQTVLANEQVQDGACERCDSEVQQKNLKQWFLRIRDYAEDLLKHDKLDWPKKTKLMQKNWIGRSEGADITFVIGPSSDVIIGSSQDGKAANSGKAAGASPDRPQTVDLKVYTTRPDTLFGATYMVVAPEHELIETFRDHIENFDEVSEYIKAAGKKNALERTDLEKEKTGIELRGLMAINPVNSQAIPVWTADYVLSGYGTGAIMAVPAHDERDFAFAKKFGLPIVQVISSQNSSGKDVSKLGFSSRVRAFSSSLPYIGDGVLVNSGKFDGLDWREGKKRITKWLSEQGLGEAAVQYKLRDWLISRQRYWGAPIPIVYCSKCGGEVPVPASDLPVELPTEGVDYTPRGKSPLASVPSFVSTQCPSCGGAAEREVDTMDTFMCSSWYFLRYLSSTDEFQAFDRAVTDRWMPVDMYIGGPEHACMHLLYARFIHKVLMDDRMSEPFSRLVHQGLVTKDGAKMSKSKGNVVSPDEFVEKYGADVFRMYLMFMGPFTEGGDWDDRGITGIARFVEKVYMVVSGVVGGQSDGNAISERRAKRGAENFPLASPTGSERRAKRGASVSRDSGTASGTSRNSDILIRALHKTIKKVGEDLENMRFNTAIAALMEFVNLVVKVGCEEQNDHSIHGNEEQNDHSIHGNEEKNDLRTDHGTSLPCKGISSSPLDHGTSLSHAAGAHCKGISSSLLDHETATALVRLIAPLAPHLAEELWEMLGQKFSVFDQEWPTYDPSLILEEEIELVVQVNGKVRGRVRVPTDISEEDAFSKAREVPNVAKHLSEASVQKEIYVPGKLVSFVLSARNY